METLRSFKSRLESEVTAATVGYNRELQERQRCITMLESELHEARVYIDERRAIDEHNANLSLELEREKGRLAGG